jgi:hypothetical protein
MDAPNLIKPKEIEMDGKTYILSKFTAETGREILAVFPLSALPKIGDYKTNKEMALKIYSHIAVPRGPGLAPMPLNMWQLVNQHVDNAITGYKLEKAMIEYNFGFFLEGRVSTFFQDIAQKLPDVATKILMVFWERLSQRNTTPSNNLETTSQ